MRGSRLFVFYQELGRQLKVSKYKETSHWYPIRIFLTNEQKTIFVYRFGLWLLCVFFVVIFNLLI